jgi:hypothetical protein
MLNETDYQTRNKNKYELEAASGKCLKENLGAPKWLIPVYQYLPVPYFPNTVVRNRPGILENLMKS